MAQCAMARASYVASARAMALSTSPLAWFCAAQWPDFTPPLTGDPLDCAVDHLVVVADRVPADRLSQQLLSDPANLAEAGIKSVDPVGDCVAPGLIAHAIYAAHRLARSF